MAKTQRLTALIIIVLSLLGVYFIVSPYLATYQLKSAMENLDADRVLDMTDIEAIRKNLQKDLLLILEKKVPSSDNNPFAVIGRQYATKSITGMIDVMVTPNMIREVITQGSLNSASSDISIPKNASASYRSIGRFEISLESEDGHPIILELNRGEINVMSWKLVRVGMPESYLENLM